MIILGQRREGQTTGIALADKKQSGLSRRDSHKYKSQPGMLRHYCTAEIVGPSLEFT